MPGKNEGKAKSKKSVKPKRKANTSKKNSANSRKKDLSKTMFPIVGIGSSAGGLETLVQFFKNTPNDSGMAFVVIQHLDPSHKDMMVELLQRVTPMPVMQAKDKLKIKPNHIYVIPPNKDMSILHGVLHLLAPVAPRGLRLPIDFFLRSLADDQQERSIGVVLSGMGSDGTLGLRSIKEKAGVVFVQDPDTAKFTGMPGSAISAGLADVVAPADELPGKILSYIHHAPLVSKRGPTQEEKTRNGLEKVVIILRAHTGHDFSLYKKSTLYRRIERRMGLHQIKKITEYILFLRENSAETDLLFKELLIGVTSFFRDPKVWDFLSRKALPALFAEKSPGQTLRAWIPGCATGEEAYSLAITFMELLEKSKKHPRTSLQIFATDLDGDAIEKARQGVFPANISSDLSQERLGGFFDQVDAGYQVSKPIREMVIFAQQNVIMDPPFTKLDIICCRNLLIYMTPELQKKLMPLFHYSLNSSGLLILGSAETVGSFSDHFSTVDNKLKIYRRKEPLSEKFPVDFPSSFASITPTASEAPMKQKEPANLQTLTEQMLIQKYTPSAVLVNDQGDILFISGKTGKYLEPAAGKANLNIFAMAREGLRHALSGAFQKALKEKSDVVVPNIRVGTNGGVQVVNLTIHSILDKKQMQGMLLIVFSDVKDISDKKSDKQSKVIPADQTRVRELQDEVQRLLEELHGNQEEMQSSHEELKSANEELQSTNEELQSTNEELTTSKEEMQSLNEELQTVNAELQSKVDDLSRASNDMKNLLNSTDIATIFLDGKLKVRRFTEQATRIFKLIPGDVGRPLSDLVSVLDYPDLYNDSTEVLRTLVFSEKQAPTEDDRWYKVRIMPYRTTENVIDGIVITLVDISAMKKLETELRDMCGETH